MHAKKALCIDCVIDLHKIATCTTKKFDVRKYFKNTVTKPTYQVSGKIQVLDDPATLNGGMMFNRGTSAASE